VHQDSTMVPVDLESELYEHAGYSVPSVSASASIDAAAKLHITMSNANPHKDIAVAVHVGGMTASAVHGRTLQGTVMDAHNSFEKPDEVAPKAFSGATLSGDELKVLLPKMSVVALEIA
jgi:alpha-L-arabinofuranosidase